MCNRILSFIGNIIFFILVFLMCFKYSIEDLTVALGTCLVMLNGANLTLEILNSISYIKNYFKK